MNPLQGSGVSERSRCGAVPDPRADLDFGSTFVLGSSFEQGVLELPVSLKKPVFGRSWTTVFKAALHAKSLSFGSTSVEKRRRRTLRP